MQHARCAMHSNLPHVRSRRRVSRTLRQRVRTCSDTPLRTRCAQQPAAPVPRREQHRLRLLLLALAASGIAASAAGDSVAVHGRRAVGTGAWPPRASAALRATKCVSQQVGRWNHVSARRCSRSAPRERAGRTARVVTAGAHQDARRCVPRAGATRVHTRCATLPANRARLAAARRRAPQEMRGGL
jgi:hypothetical protein